MTRYTENCQICGSPLIYFSSVKTIACNICGTQHAVNVTCNDGHYVCDACHAAQGIMFINRYVHESRSKNPIHMAMEMMRNSDIAMHGPEHHYLVVAVLLTAYKNAGGNLAFEEALHLAAQRAIKVPGGICGLWGSCGAGLATGIFVSVITGATSLSKQEWSQANGMTAKSLARIAENGGPRCCKRNTYIAILEAAAYLEMHFSVILEQPDRITCEFLRRNAQCRGRDCLFFAR